MSETTNPRTPPPKWFWLCFVCDFIKCCLISVPLTCYWVYKQIYPDKPRSIVGEVALVTGGGNGLGRALAIRLAQEGCNVAICDVDFEAAKATAAEINLGNHAEAFAYQTDVSNVEEIERMKTKINADLGRVDILVNNAAILAKESLREGPSSTIQMIINVNFASHFWMIRAFLPGMLERRYGHIVAISSMAGMEGLPRACLYSATKHGVQGLMAALEEELRLDKQDFVKLTTACPYFVATRQELIDKISVRIPPMSVEYAADVIVEGVLRSETLLTVPRSNLTFMTLMSNLPSDVKRMFWERMFQCVVTKSY